AALLHDVVEDTIGTLDDIAARFGPEAAALVAEVTDDKSLPKAERKRLQVETVPHKSADAKRLKLADKASNVAAIATHPPDWPLARKQAYLDWAEQVIAGCQGADAALEAAFHQALTEARAALARDA
ncbi:MAG: HD domain-containing protein, partial [Rhodobacteraceae bacterium]|nr:HD domain-containing protein [Paracoccaceae bacterium]